MKPFYLLLIILLTASLSFALGWFMRGDAIYSAMYQKDLNNVNVEDVRK